MGNLFNMFGPSPIRLLEKHMRKAYACAKQLAPFFTAVIEQKWDEALPIKDKIIVFEKEADIIKRDLRLNLPGGLLLPFGRTDLLEVLSAQDAIANKAEDIAELITSREMIIPDTLASPLVAFVSRALEAAKQACDAINELDELLESGFRGSEVNVVDKMIRTLDAVEHECDAQLAAIRKMIFLLETHFPPIEIMFLYKLVQWIGDLADRAQTVGSRLQILIAR